MAAVQVDNDGGLGSDPQGSLGAGSHIRQQLMTWSYHPHLPVEETEA